MSTPRTIRVFIASPGDLAVERRAFKDVLEELNKGFGEGAGVQFEPLAWEETLAVMTRRSQGLINQEIDRCDVFVLAMHRRWGQEALDAKPYSSYTEEEFHRAFDRWHRTGTPTIFVFFKDIDPGQMADPGKQLQQVLDFRRQLESQRQLIYRPFADVDGFRDVLQRHLKAYVKGELPKADAALETAEREHNAAEAATARAETFALEFAERAAKAAFEGRVEEARQDFAKATDGTANLRVLFLAFEFYYRTGDLTTAEEVLERSLAISGPDAESADTAAAFGNLGLIYLTRGDSDRAEEVVRKRLAIEEKLGRHKGMAGQYGNLGLIYEIRGHLDRAEEMHLKSLAIEEKRGRQEGIALQYGNLGAIYWNGGKLDRAEEMHLKSLAIYEKLGQQEDMARQYGNLGLTYIEQGDLDRAEEMHLKSLAIEEKRGHHKGMARQYGNLGLTYIEQGDLDRAEKMFQKSLDISEKLGFQEYMANQYGNLGSVAEDRGDSERARELWTKARNLYAEIGMPHRVKEQQEWLDDMP